MESEDTLDVTTEITLTPLDTPIESKRKITPSKYINGEKYIRNIVWSAEATFFLLEKVKDLRELWDPTHKLFLKKTRKRNAYKVARDAVCQEFPAMKCIGLNEDDIQHKFHKLRSSFMREARKFHSPLGGDDTRKSKWIFYDPCMFMLEGIREFREQNCPSLCTNCIQDPYRDCNPTEVPMFKVDVNSCHFDQKDGRRLQDFQELTSQTCKQEGCQSPAPTPELSTSESVLSPSLAKCKRKRKKSISTLEKVNQTLLQVGDLLGELDSRMDSKTIEDRAAEMVRSFLTPFSDATKKRLTLQIVTSLQNAVLTEEDLQ